MSGLLHKKIATAQVKHGAVAAGTGLALACACFFGFLALAVAADRFFDLSWGARVNLLAVNVGAALACLVWKGVTPLIRGVDDQTIALAVERMEPAFATRLISAIQLGKPGALTGGESHAIARAMIDQTERLAAPLNFRRAVNTGSLRRWTAATLTLLVLAALLYFLAWPSSPVLLRRAFGAHAAWPSRTQVQVLSGSFLIGQGDSAVLRAGAVGYQPGAGQAEITYASGQRQTIALQPTDDHQFAGAIEHIAESFRYRIRLYDGLSDEFTVRALPRPVALSVDCTQIFPAYTGIAEMPREPADLVLLAGSRLRITVTTNEALRVTEDANAATPPSCVRFRVRPSTPAVAPVLLQPSPTNAQIYTAELPLPDNVSGFSLALVDRDGLESKNAPIYPVTLVQDRPPSIRVLAPIRRETLATADATVTVGFLAEDDYGLARIALHYRAGQGAEHVIPLAVSANQKQIRGHYPWRVSTLIPPTDHNGAEGATYEYYLEASDANDLNGPGVAESDHYQLRIVSKAEKEAELVAHMGASFGEVQDLSDKQRQAATDLGTLMMEEASASQPAPQPAP